jgi:hypothetical protein
MSLAAAPAIPVLMGEQRDARHARATARWTARLALQRESFTLPTRPPPSARERSSATIRRARRALMQITCQHDVPRVERLLGVSGAGGARRLASHGADSHAKRWWRLAPTRRSPLRVAAV